MYFKQFLAEADSRGDEIVQDDRRLAEGLVLDGFDVHAKVTGITHQEQGREVAKYIGQPGESTAYADVCLHFVMAGWAKGCEIFKPVRFIS